MYNYAKWDEASLRQVPAVVLFSSWEQSKTMALVAHGCGAAAGKSSSDR
jgi:hypothetical protein